jgi:PAS domain S-box-containing protein
MTADAALIDSQEFARRFLARVASPVGFEVLFDYVPDVYFFVKDADGRFVRANRAFLVLVGARQEEDLIGARDADFFSANWAENYRRDDREVLRLGEGMIDKAELVRNPDGSVDWFCTTKLPLLDARGNAIGICGIMREVKKMTTNNDRFLSWAPVLETILNDYASPLETADLARRMAISVSQFNRQFKKRFHATPRSYLLNVRLNAACYFLVSTELSMSDIAQRTGFYDQSHFTNQFVKTQGTPPSKYRLLHAKYPVLRRMVPTADQGMRSVSQGSDARVRV